QLLVNLFDCFFQHAILEGLLLLFVFLDLGRGVAGPADHVPVAPPLVVLDAFLVAELDLDVRLHAPFFIFLALGKAMDVAAARAPVAGGSQLEGAAAVFERDDVLHAAFAEAAFADDDGAQVVLQGGSENLAGTGTVAVDEDTDGIVQTGIQILEVLVMGIEDFFLLVIAALGGDDGLALGQEHRADLDRSAEQAARVVAQVDHQAVHVLLLQGIEDLEQFRHSGFCEGDDANVGDLRDGVDPVVPFLEVVGLALVAHDAVDGDLGAGDVDVDGRLGAFVQDVELDLGAGLALDHLDGLLERHAFGGLALDLENEVAGQHARFIGGGAG